MMVDHGSPVPAYAQLVAILRTRIKAGEWQSGPLPSIKALQETCGVGRDTAMHAIQILRDEGLVFTVSRRGTYVARGPASVPSAVSA
jgi:GntR family transcriptional regulator/MocR family aminotransferase